MKWKVTLYNQHACCGIGFAGTTRCKAFLKAYHKAGSEFLGYMVQSPAVTWLALYNDCVAYMRRGSTSSTLSLPQGIAIEIRRIAS